MDLLLMASIKASLQGTQTISSNSSLVEEIPSLGFSMMTMTFLEEASDQGSVSRDKNHKNNQSRKLEEVWGCVWPCLKMMMMTSSVDADSEEAWVEASEEALGAAVCSNKCKWVEAVAGFRRFNQVLFLVVDQDLHQCQRKRIWKMERK